MKTFIVHYHATAEIEEIWEVAAKDEDEAREIIENDLLSQHRLIRDRVTGEEHCREVLSVTPAKRPKDPCCQCQNCDWNGPIHEAEPVHDIWSRVVPGEIMPAGDCPDCGALVHLLDGGRHAGNR